MSGTEHRPYWFKVGDVETKHDPVTWEIMQRMAGELRAAIYRTKEEGIRKALVALGWTPPGDAPPADLLRRLQTHAEDHGGNLRRPFGFYTHDYYTIKADARLAGEYARKMEGGDDA